MLIVQSNCNLIANHTKNYRLISSFFFRNSLTFEEFSNRKPNVTSLATQLRPPHLPFSVHTFRYLFKLSFYCFLGLSFLFLPSRCQFIGNIGNLLVSILFTSPNLLKGFISDFFIIFVLTFNPLTT